MIKRIQRNLFPLAMVLITSLSLSYWLMTRNSTVYSAVAPVVSTLSVIREGAATPVRVAADRSGNMYVTDPRGGGVLKYNSAGNLLQKIATTSKNILGVAIAKSGEILVSQGNVVAVYSVSGAKTAEFGSFGTANGIAVDDTGTIFVADSKNNAIQLFSADYKPLSSFGSTGSGNDQFKQPTGIAFEKLSRQLAVTDTLNGRVQFFSPAGVYQKTVGSFGAGPLKFTSPQAIAFEYSPDGTSLVRLYVVDSFQANVQVIDAASGTFLRYISSYGTRSGHLVTPGDVLLDSFNRLIIPNGTGNLAVFGVEPGAPPVTTGGAVTFPSPSSGSSPPALTLNTLNSIVKVSAITLSGTVTSGSAVTVNGTPALVDATGNWSLPVTLTQQGLNNLMVIASKNGSSSSLSAYVTLDSTPPVITTLSLPQNNSTTSTPIHTITGAVTDFTALSVTVTVNGSPQTIPVNDGLFTVAVVLASGPNSISVAAVDAAGLSSQTYASTVTYNPLAPAITVATASGAVSASASYTVLGTAPANSQVTVNGIAATVTGTGWTATIPLLAGINQIDISAATAGNQVTSTLSSSVLYAPGQPSLAVTSPAVDSATATAAPVLSGIASSGSLITASLGGATIPVTVAPDGSFTVAVPAFASPGTYPVTVTAVDANGKLSSTIRTLVYDPTPPTLMVTDSNPASIKVSSANGVVIAKDKNGLIATPDNSNGTSALNLTGAVFDLASLNIYALTPAGISSRNGDINGDGKVDIADALLAMQISLGIAPAPTFEQLLRVDVAPLVNHVPVPDGRIRLDDAILILQKAIGIVW